jgi:hypothetical protein
MADQGWEVTAAQSGSSGSDGGMGDWPPNLLARIATTIGRRHQENAASTALLYVIQADDHARRAVVADLARRAGLAAYADLPDDLFFAGQDHGEDGRPDIVGLDDCARTRVVIEAKVDAGFQPNQITRYRARLASGLPSVLAVLAPERRLPRLLQEARHQLTGAEIELGERGPLTWQTADRTLTLLGISWLATLEAMENVTSFADLGQLRGFYDYLESAIFLPFATADLARANGRLMRSVTSVAQNVAATFPAAERGSTMHHWSYSGQLLVLHGRTAWFGVWLDAWAQREDTPYWLTYHKDALPPARAAQILPELNAIAGIRAHRDETYLCAALFPRAEVGRAEVEKALTKLIDRVADLVR